MKTKKSKIKKPSVTKEKKKAWAVFSQYIRRKYADTFGMVKCVTCGIVKHYKEMHAGHYIDGRNNTILYDEMLVHPQCFHCNSKHMGCLAGNKVAYTVFMIEKYGLTIQGVKALDNLKHNSKPMKAYEHQEIYKKYSELNAQLTN